jgi:hypothetical protein
MLATIGLAAVLGTAARIETAFVRIPHSTEQVAIHCMKPQHARDTGVLFVHGPLSRPGLPRDTSSVRATPG